MTLPKDDLLSRAVLYFLRDVRSCNAEAGEWGNSVSSVLLVYLHKSDDILYGLWSAM